jgi:hypothetical protein
LQRYPTKICSVSIAAAAIPTASDSRFSSACFVFPGWPPQRPDRVPLPLLLYFGEQLQIQTDNIEEYFHRQPHPQRASTRDHRSGTTVYFQKAIRAITGVGNPVPENVIPHLSPLGWEHITFTGSYHWREHAGDINILRPLRTFKLLDKKRKTS